MKLVDLQDHMWLEHCSVLQLYSLRLYSPSDNGLMMFILYLCMLASKDQC